LICASSAAVARVTTGLSPMTSNTGTSIARTTSR
jgi:hypothetical protein